MRPIGDDFLILHNPKHPIASYNLMFSCSMKSVHNKICRTNLSILPALAMSRSLPAAASFRRRFSLAITRDFSSELNSALM